MKFLEYLYYETLPYLYGTLGIFAMSQHEVSKIAAFGGIVLTLCSYQVFYQRYFHRTYANKHKMRI